MYFDQGMIGRFAVTREAFVRGDPAALFRMLVTTVMFQRRQDLQIMRILRGISPEEALELTDVDALLALADAHECPHNKSLDALLNRCDLTKDKQGRGCCEANAALDCPLKLHTVLLKRYGHFGKVPLSAALMLRAHGAEDLEQLRQQVLAEAAGPAEASRLILERLAVSWRISEKIGSMFLSAVTNPALDPEAPWQEGLDHARFVVIDSNVDLFLRAINYQGAMTSYARRREFIQALAEAIDLSAMQPGVSAYNPRIVQQAMYLFMSVTHRRHLSADCSHDEPPPCARCPDRLKALCAASPHG